MADADDIRRLALALPGVQEIDSDGFDFRVGDKGFVWSYPERTPGQPRRIRTDIAVLYVGDEAEKQALLLGEPDLFFTASGYDGWPLVMLRLEKVDGGRLAELVTDAWRMRAPDELDAQAGAGKGGLGLLSDGHGRHRRADPDQLRHHHRGGRQRRGGQGGALRAGLHAAARLADHPGQPAR
jgi:hypothetical protein